MPMMPTRLELEAKLATIKRVLTEIRAPYGNSDALACIDLTLLDDEASTKDIQTLAQKAAHYGVAAVCVLPKHLSVIAPHKALKRATVVNFPSGCEEKKVVLDTIKALATQHLVDEIDFVFPYGDYLAGNQQQALAYCHQIAEYCQQYQLCLKVILETGALSSIDMVYEIACHIVRSGCDFLKTSTGKIAQGASIPAVFAMLSAILDEKSSCGMKVSGGVKIKEDAFAYMHLAQYMLNKPLDKHWFRIGASSLLDDLV